MALCSQLLGYFCTLLYLNCLALKPAEIANQLILNLLWSCHQSYPLLEHQYRYLSSNGLNESTWTLLLTLLSALSWLLSKGCSSDSLVCLSRPIRMLVLVADAIRASFWLDFLKKRPLSSNLPHLELLLFLNPSCVYSRPSVRVWTCYR